MGIIDNRWGFGDLATAGIGIFSLNFYFFGLGVLLVASVALMVAHILLLLTVLYCTQVGEWSAM